MAKYSKVYLKWHDIAWDTRSWVEGDDFPEPIIMESIAWLVHEEPTYIVTAGTISEDGDFGEVMAIPKCVIKEKRIIK